MMYGNAAGSANGLKLQRLASRLRFRHIQLLVTLKDVGSLHAAAQALHLTQPSLSKMLHEIEQAFDQVLFERSARGLTPTASGTAAMHGALMLLQDLDRLRQELATRPPQMLLRIGAPPFVAFSFLPFALARVREISNDVRVELTEGGVPGLVQKLLDGKLDALVTSFASELSEAAGAGATIKRLYTTRIAVVAAATHCLAGSRQVTWPTLAGERWILPPRGSRVRRFVDDVFAESGLMTPVPSIESGNPVSNLMFASTGVGLAVVPEQCLSLVATPQPICQLRLRKRLPEGTVALVCRKGEEHPRMRVLREALRTLRQSA